MATCPNCKKQELKSGENLCPHCNNKKTNFWVKAAEGALGILVVVAAIVKGGKGT